jgi:hypothetical protein
MTTRSKLKMKNNQQEFRPKLELKLLVNGKEIVIASSNGEATLPEHKGDLIIASEFISAVAKMALAKANLQNSYPNSWNSGIFSDDNGN